MNDTLWKILHSLWVFATLILYIPGLPIFFVGIRANNRKWIIIGIILQLPVVLFALLYSFNITWLNQVLALLVLISIISAFIYALMIRNEYLDVLRGKINYNTQNNYQNQIINNHNINNFTNTNSQNTNIIDFRNLSEAASDRIVAIDINKASYDEIEQLPGINIILAKKIMNARNQGITFSNIKELAEYLDISEDHMNRLEKYIKFSTKYDSPINSRRIDL